MIQPNNLRNRWRRYRDTCIAYGWTFLPFRHWATSWGRNPDSYSASKGAGNERVRLRRPRTATL